MKRSLILPSLFICLLLLVVLASQNCEAFSSPSLPRTAATRSASFLASTTVLPSHALGQDDFRTDEVGEVNHPDDASGDSALTIGLGALGLFGVILGSPAGSIGSALGQHRLDDGSMATLAVDAIFLVIAAGESLFADDGSS